MKTLLAALLLGTISVAAFAGGGDAKKDKAALQGTWVAAKGAKKIVMKFKGENFTVEFDGMEKGNGTYKIDPSKTPKTIDMMVKESSDANFVGKTSLGIYELSENKLKWCANEPGKDQRPAEFSGDGFLLVVFDKQAK